MSEGHGGEDEGAAASEKVEAKASGGAAKGEAKPETTATRTAGGTFALFFGFFSFGLLLGLTTSLSNMKGISQTLLNSLFTFVGGVLLSYAGFRVRTRKGGRVEIDVGGVGASLIAISWGTIAGFFWGFSLRATHADPREAPEPAPTSAEHAAPSSSVPAAAPHAPRDVYALNSSEREKVCADVLRHLDAGTFYDGIAGSERAKADLGELCKPKP